MNWKMVKTAVLSVLATLVAVFLVFNLLPREKQIEKQLLQK